MWSCLVRLIKQHYYQAYFHAVINSTLLGTIDGSAILHPVLLAQYNLCQSSKVYSNAGGLYLMLWYIISSNAAIQKQAKQTKKHLYVSGGVNALNYFTPRTPCIQKQPVLAAHLFSSYHKTTDIRLQINNPQ